MTTVAAHVAVALRLDLIETAFRAVIFAIGHAAVADTLIDAGLLVVNAVFDFAGTGSERDEGDESGSDDEGFDSHDDDSKERCEFLLLESTQIAAMICDVLANFHRRFSPALSDCYGGQLHAAKPE